MFWNSKPNNKMNGNTKKRSFPSATRGNKVAFNYKKSQGRGRSSKKIHGGFGNANAAKPEFARVASSVVSVPLPLLVKDELRDVCSAQGLTMSAYCRAAIMRAVSSDDPGYL